MRIIKFIFRLPFAVMYVVAGYAFFFTCAVVIPPVIIVMVVSLLRFMFHVVISWAIEAPMTYEAYEVDEVVSILWGILLLMPPLLGYELLCYGRIDPNHALQRLGKIL